MPRAFPIGLVALSVFAGCAVLTSLDDLRSGSDASTFDGAVEAAVDAAVDSGADAPADVSVDAPTSFAPTIVQGFGSWVFGSATPVVITSPNPQTKGNFNFVAVSFQTDGAQTSVVSISDTDGNTYAAAVPASYSTQSTPANVVGQTIWYAKNIHGGTSANKITVTSVFNPGADAGAGDQDIRVVEIAGLDSSTPLVGTNQHSGSGTTDTSNAVITTSPALLVAAGVLEYAAPFVDAGAPFALIATPTSAPFGIVEYEIADAGGSFSATALSSQANYLMQIVALR